MCRWPARIWSAPVCWPRVDIRHGDARVTLKKMVEAREQPFDLVFIDADKPSYPIYLDYAVQLTQPGSVILADNVIRDGKVAHSGETDPIILGHSGVQQETRRAPEARSDRGDRDAQEPRRPRHRPREGLTGRMGKIGFALASVWSKPHGFPRIYSSSSASNVRLVDNEPNSCFS